MEFLKVDGAYHSDRKVPEESIDNDVVKSIDPSNMRGHVIARVLIVGQYLNVFESTKK